MPQGGELLQPQLSPQHVATKTSSRGSVDARADAQNRGVHFYKQRWSRSFPELKNQEEYMRNAAEYISARK